jgi:hypothetical protein
VAGDFDSSKLSEMSLDLYTERKRVSVTFAGDDAVGKHIASSSAKSKITIMAT